MRPGSIVIELTNRCNLTCGHCLPERHGGATDLSLDALAPVLATAPGLGFDRISYTGGEPTMHPHFAEVLRMTAAAGVRFGLVTNGWNFSAVYPRIDERRTHLIAITFSLDGGTRATHDSLRGEGSFLRLMKAFSVCAVTGIPFTVNMVLTAGNRHEVEQAAQLAADLGARGIRFGHLMPSANSVAQGLAMSASERDEADAAIRQLQPAMKMPVAMAPGYRTAELFPCEPLHLRELNIDAHGRVSKCCHLSGYAAGDSDRAGRLPEASFAELVERIREDNARFRAAKERRHAAGELTEANHWPCLYCAEQYGKLGTSLLQISGAGSR